jgi:hypothetical protein
VLGMFCVGRLAVSTHWGMVPVLASEERMRDEQAIRGRQVADGKGIGGPG